MSLEVPKIFLNPVRSEATTAAKVNIIFLGYQLGHLMLHLTLKMGAEMVLGMFIIFNQLTLLIACKYFINFLTLFMMRFI
jgi:hypothetical protein